MSFGSSRAYAYTGRAEPSLTWMLVDRPKNKNVIGVKWVFRTKMNVDGSINKFKARLVVKGYAQQYGVDFTDTFAPIARFETIRLLFAIAAQSEWRIYQLVVKLAFLNGHLNEEIFIEQLEGFIINGKEDKVYLLRKALYGLKQAPRSWYNRIDKHLSSLGFSKNINEQTLYIKQVEEDLIIISLYVDDILITGSNATLIEVAKNEINKYLR